MSTHYPFFNRELSWLAFNRRVLEQAEDTALPVLERLKFLAITSSNLDEFFMVRVGGLKILLEHGHNEPDIAGLSPMQQLQEIRSAVLAMTHAQYECLHNRLLPTLERNSISRVRISDLTSEQYHYLDNFFNHEIYPVITPIALDTERSFPLLPGLGLNLLVRLAPEDNGSVGRYAIIAIPKALPRFLTVPFTDNYNYIHIEDLISAFLEKMFPGETIQEAIPFRIARNVDFSVRDDLITDLLQGMKDVLLQRKHSQCIRLEITDSVSEPASTFIQERLSITEDDTYRLPGTIDLTAYFRLASMPGYESLKISHWAPQPSPIVDKQEPMFETLTRQDVLLHHPYESFGSVTRFIEEAANDPDVLAIKQILYRTSENSRIITALKRAADNGKHVTVLVELKARFDEARNIEWAQELERVGVQVIYGLRELKVHAKICLIVRREPEGIKRYMHFGTGNYNEKTATLYSDISYMTCREDYGSDASLFFNTITGYSQPVNYGKLEAAPIGIRPRLLELIEAEIERQKQGQKGHIMAKFNSLVHPEIIEALYRASNAGVQIELNIRGICCLVPGLSKISKKIRVVSIVDRFLEHSRIFYFRNGGDPRVFLSSADWMPRNLDRRVELLVPVETTEAKNRLIRILQTSLADNQQAWELMPDGSYKRLKETNPKKQVRSQEVFHREACRAAEEVRSTFQIQNFEPMRSDKKRSTA